MHEGLVTSETSQTQTAFVEIIFDNVDQRFPTGHDTVNVKRLITLSKDEYMLDGKSVSKLDITNLFQSAGFSKSNPYYIVPQGRITALTNAKDSDRLQLLKEVAGTKVYEEHREESFKLMEETQQKKEKIDELLFSINEKISKLDKEKNDLLKYQDLDKQKRSLEYNILKRELQETELALAQFDEATKEDLDSSLLVRKEYSEKDSKIRHLENELLAMEKELEILNVEYGHIVQTRSDAAKDVNKFTRAIREAEEASEENAKQESLLAKEFAKLESEIQARTSDLATVTLRNSALENEEAKLKGELEGLRSQKDALQLKQGRSRQFNTAKERDSFLHGEISSLKSKYAFEEKKEVDLYAAIETLRAKENQETHTLMDLKGQQLNLLKMQEDLEIQINEDSRAKDRLVELRKQYWREENKLSSIVPSLQEEVSKQERHIYGTLDKTTISGLEAVRKITRRLGLESSVYGPVYELLSVDPIYYTSIEMVAGNSLFHVVVENDIVASAILEEILKDKCGRVTFVPLNRLRIEPLKKIPPINTTSTSMLSILQYESVFEAVFQQIFGKTWIVESLVLGSELCRQYDVNVITLEGDRADRKGTLTGGYVDTKTCRLSSASKSKCILEKLSGYESQLSLVKDNLNRTNQEIVLRSGNLQVQESNLFKVQRDLEYLGRQINEARIRLEETQQLLVEKNKQGLEEELKVLSEKILALENEIGTPLVQKLSAEESILLKQLEGRCNELTGALLKVSQERNLQVASEMSKLKHLIEDNLLKRYEKIGADLEIIKRQQKRISLNEETPFREAVNRVNEAKVKEGRILVIINGFNENKEKVKKQLESVKGSLEKLTKKMQQVETSQTKMTAKKAALLERQLSVQKKIDALGLVPEDASKYTKMTGILLMSSLQGVNEKLKAYCHVNKKAFEQSHTYLKERGSLQSRKQELEDSQKSIEQFIGNLDQQKDIAVVRTFDQVSRYFKDIFHKLVPNGEAKLVNLRDFSGKTTESTSKNLNLNGTSTGIASFTGIGIEVVLNGAQMRMQQLSGGQKSIVALSLIFAIQKCDPAPFYLFDEIDANLDAGHRSAVAAMIHEMKQHVSNEFGGGGHVAQFITTTFRPEMLQQADKYYGVTFANRLSKVQAISKEAAMEFIQQDREE